jgi:hypothetical protein
MFAGVFAAAAAGGLGAGAFVSLLAAVVVGLLALRSLRDPPWTPAGRRSWSANLQGWRRLLVGLAGRAGAARHARAGGERADTAAAYAPTPPPEVAPGARLSVRCEVANERLQVWHSTATRRAYEVPAERGLPQAYPGAVGDLVFERGRPRVVPRDVN